MTGASVVEKATSDMLIGPDWALNLDLCDAINNDPSQAKEIVKAVKKRLTNRNPQVQLLTLTVLETLIKNCGDNVHQQVAEKDVLHELVKLVKKKADLRVRDKILVLLDSWQEAFGGAGGRFPQYYLAYKELQKAGFEFPRRGGESSVPIFTPPQSQPISSPRRPPQQSAWSSGPPAIRPDETDDVSGMGHMSLADIKNARNLAELCNEMISALNPRDRMSAKEEVIVEIVDQCRMHQRRVMQLVNDTSNEELLGQGLSLNDDLQRVLARYGAFLSGAPLPESFSENKSPPEAGDSSRPKGSARTVYPALPLAPPPSTGKRPVRPTPIATVTGTPAEATFDLLSGDPEYNLLSERATEASSPPSMELAIMDPPPRPPQEDLMTLTLSDQPPPPADNLLALPAPEANTNPFETTPFIANPPASSTPSFQPRVDPPVSRAEPSYTAAPSFPIQPTRSQQYYPQPQPVTTTPPPWQEDTQADQQWQQQGYGNPQQMYYQGQQQPQYAGYNQGQQQPQYAGYNLNQAYQLPPNELPRFGSVGAGPGDNFANQYLNGRGIYTPSSGLSSAGTSKANLKSPDTLFHDLVDLRSVKAATLANKTGKTTKAGP